MDTPAQLLPDRSEIDWQNAHPDNSVADVVNASRSALANPAGYTWEAHLWNGLADWSLGHGGPQFAGGTAISTTNGWTSWTGRCLWTRFSPGCAPAWTRVLRSIGVTNTHPGIGSDDYVVVTGYEAGSPPRLAYLDPKDPAHAVHWRDFIPARTGMGSGWSSISGLQRDKTNREGATQSWRSVRRGTGHGRVQACGTDQKSASSSVPLCPPEFLCVFAFSR